MADEQTTPLPEMVERVARAIARADMPEVKLPATAFLAPVYVDMARAAIEAMRQPTVEMSDEGYQGGDTPHPTKTWQIMIDAALGR